MGPPGEDAGTVGLTAGHSRNRRQLQAPDPAGRAEQAERLRASLATDSGVEHPDRQVEGEIEVRRLVGKAEIHVPAGYDAAVDR